jgi:hypothetical protein
LLQAGPSVFSTTLEHLHVFPNRNSPTTLTLATSSPLTAYQLDPLSFFDGHTGGLKLLRSIRETRNDEVLPRQLSRFVRTPGGQGLGIVREDGTVEVWKTTNGGRHISFMAEVNDTEHDLSLMALLHGGMCVQSVDE